MDQQKIGTFLKELRNEKNLTQEQLAEILGVSRRTVSRWETGSNLPDLDDLIEMADYYDVDMREFMYLIQNKLLWIICVKLHISTLRTYITGY